MAEFQNAFLIVLKNEGGYVNDPIDNGAETYMGISRKFWPNWAGWAIIDDLKPLSNGEVIGYDQLTSQVKQFYKSNYWDKCMLDACDSQKIAEFIFDFYVNAGGNGISVIQEVVGVLQDGHCGHATIDAVNGLNEELLLSELISARIEYYKKIVAKNPAQNKFLNGWINRANSFLT